MNRISLKEKNRMENLKVFVVELNPLAEFASSGLFTWEKDKGVLFGDLPFEFRTSSSVDPFAQKNINPNWAKHLNE